MSRPPGLERTVGLCLRCTQVRVVTSAKGSTFYLCRAPTRPKYPPLPVLSCPAYVPEVEPERA
ncbi:MAG: hypothetical protein AAF447_08395 [Myxococcota bacterium]